MTRDALRAYVSDALATWAPTAPDWALLEGALLFADVSGFTALSERLEDHGREGAELLSRVVSEVLTGFVGAARCLGSDVLAFGGDAILVHVAGDAAAARAVQAAVAMQHIVRTPVDVASLGDVPLSVSIGIHVGSTTLLRLHLGRQTEAVAVGPTVTRTLRTEGAAEAGQVLLSHDAAAAVPAEWLGARTADGILVDVEAIAPPVVGPVPDPVPATVPVSDLLAPEMAEVAGTLSAVGQHRRVAVGFVRVARLDEVVAEEGPAAAHALLTRSLGVLADECGRTGVSLLTVDSYPDAVKVLVTAGAPIATDDNDTALVEALRATAQRLEGTDVHLGANRGLAFAGDLGAPTRRGYTLLGDTVNLAARLMQKAGAGEFVATEPLVERTQVARTRLPPFRVKGKVDDVRAFRVEAGEGERAMADLPIVGRDTEVDHLVRVGMAALGGTTVACEVVADAGIGKSRLARELVNRVPDLQPYLGRATAYTAATPYGLTRRLLRVLLGIPRAISSDDAGRWLADLVRRSAPDLLPDLDVLAGPLDVTLPDHPPRDEDPQVRQRRAARTAAALVRRVRVRPMLVVVDDADLVDGASREVLRRLATDGHDRPWMIVTLHRSGENTTLAGLPEVDRLRLDPLDETAAGALVRLAAGDRAIFDDEVASVVAHARGNCLYLVEYGASDGGEIPDDVESMLAARLDRLGPGDRRLLDVAAVVGTAVSAGVATAVSDAVDGVGTSPDDWAALRGFLVPSRAGELQWVEPVYREAAYAALPFARRRALHAAVFHAIERGPSDGSASRLAALATHADRAALAEEAWELLRKSGEQAALEGASVDAVALLARAVHWADELGMDRVPPSSLVDTLQTLATAAELSGRFADGREALRRAVAITDDPAMQARLSVPLGRIRMQEGDYAEARALIEHAWRVGGETRVAADVALAGLEFRQGNYDEALRRAEAVVGLGDIAPPTLRARAHLVGDAAASYVSGSTWTAGQGLHISEELGDDVSVAHARINLGFRAYYEGAWTDAVDQWRHSADAARRAGDLVHVATARNNVAEITSDRGSWEEAAEEFRAARTTWSASDYHVGVALATSNLGRALGRLGETQAGLVELAAAEQLFGRLEVRDMMLDVVVRRAEALWIGGEPEHAARLLQAIEADVTTQPAWLQVAHRRMTGCLVAVDGGRDQALRATADAAATAGLPFEQLQALAVLVADGTASRDDTETVAVLSARLGVVRLAMPSGPWSVQDPLVV